MCVDLWIPMGILGWDGDEHPFAGRFRKNGAIYWFRPRNVVKNVGIFWGFKHQTCGIAQAIGLSTDLKKGRFS